MPVRGSRRLVPLAVLASCIACVSAWLLTRDGTLAPDSLPNRRETARCVIWTDLDGERLDFHAKFFEGFWDWFEQEYYRVPAAAKLPILLFSKEADYTAFRTASGGPDTPFGYYEFTADGECMLVVNLSSGLGTATHEFVHHFVRLGFGERAPFWMNEGFAQFFEKFMGHIDASGALQISFGYFSNWRFPAAKQRVEAFSLAGLVQNRDEDHVALRELFLFLHKRGRLKPLLDAMRSRQGDPDGTETLAMVWGRPLQDLEQHWKEWIRSQPIDLDVNLVPRSFVLTAPEWKAWWEENKDRLEWSTEERIYRARVR